MKKIVALSVVVVLSLLALATALVAFTNILVYQFPPRERAEHYRAQKIVPPPPFGDSLKVMDWNIKFGGGRIDFFFDCYGDRVIMTPDEVSANLEGLARKINQYDPDVLLLQEIETGSKRAAFVDMMQWLLDKTKLNYGCYASQWKVNYIPSRGLGKMNSGVAILSKYPLANAERIALPLMQSQDPLTRFFYLRRCILTADLILPSDTLAVAVTHISAYDKEGLRLKQLKILKSVCDSLVRKRGKMLMGGDLNTVPPGTKKLKNFDDSVCKDDEFIDDDYSGETEYLLPFYKDYREAVSLEEYRLNESRYYSHTVNGRGFWNRRLDYLFTNMWWTDGMVHQDTSTGGMETMPLSDHAPVTGTLWLKSKTEPGV
ncbi:MAG: endonuclease/exonuclease/phosphatase family protein [Bacteroidia bacterium]|nr:endonuclease/exonuclease/phosphatase family protein [Bacteroidia bacterium]MDW8333573.1 endonuclease/exonuclease/phosphatase family protein [Bacteroidia bacterium]